MSEPELIHLRPGDAERAAALTGEVGWNESPALWRHLLGWAGEGGRGLVLDGQLVAVGHAICYANRRAWIGGIITSPRHQRQGFGTRIMRALIDHAQAQGCEEIALDASDQGQPMYTKLGFHPLYTVENRAGIAPDSPSDPAFAAHIRPFEPADLPSLVALDAETFGVERGWLVDQVVNQYSDRVWVDATHEGLRGFACVRTGDGGNRIGPLTHVDPRGAGALLRTALQPLKDQPVKLTLSTLNLAAMALAAEIGFMPESTGTRMLRSQTHAMRERSDYCYGILLVASG